MANPPKFKIKAFLLNISPHVPDDVRMGNLDVRLALLHHLHD